MFLSSNFTLEELITSSTAQKFRINNVPDEFHIVNLSRLCREILQPIRNRLAQPLIVTSGFRCEALNRIIGGSKTSQHLKGEAADIVCDNNKKLWNIILNMITEEEITVGQLIDEKNLRWIHISLPDSKHKNQIIKIL